MRYSIAALAETLDADVFGDADFVIEALAEPASAKPNELALATNPKYAEALAEGQAKAALLWDGADWESLGLVAAICPKRPRFAMSSLTGRMDPGQGLDGGIHPTAVIDPSADLGAGVSVGAFTVIGADAEIGPNSVIGPQCHVGWGAKIGSDALVRDHVSIGARVRIGDRFIAQPGVRIGGDGFSFVTPEKSSVENVRESLGDQGDAAAQAWSRIHSLGAVIIGDDVEIGTNTAIDNGTIRPTEIGNGTKIDNLVHIGHNCVIGNDCLICGCVGMAGSAKIGNNVVMAGQVGISDNITVGDRVICGAAAKVMRSVPAGQTVLGYPATKMDMQIESYKSSRRLPRLFRDVAALKKAVFKDGASD